MDKTKCVVKSIGKTIAIGGSVAVVAIAAAALLSAFIKSQE